MLLSLLLNSGVGLDRSPSLGSLPLHWLGHLPSLTSPTCFARSEGFIESYTEGWLSPVRVKIVSEGFQSSYKVKSVILQSKLVILQGTLVGHLKSVMLNDLNFFSLQKFVPKSSYFLVGLNVNKRE